MSKLSITVIDSLSEDLRESVRKLSDTQPLMESIGQAYETLLKDHFLTLNKRPNKSGFTKKNFWEDIANKTSFESATKTESKVAIADRRFNAKVFGAVITPKNKKALAIPLTDLASQHSPKSNQNSLSPFLKLIPLKGKPSILATETDGEITPQYVLLKRVRIPKEPNALPKESEISKCVSNEIENYISFLKQLES